MSDSETESVQAVEVPAPPKKSRPPVSNERRKQMLENLAKGRKTRAANLSNQRLDKEKAQVKRNKNISVTIAVLNLNIKQVKQSI